jgi:hypothetical protein
MIREQPDSWPVKFVISWTPVHAFGLNKIRKSKPQEGHKGTMEMRQPEFNDREDPASLTRMYNAIQKFNRNTTWVATGLLGSVIFAALIIALQDRQSKSDDLANKESQSRLDANREKQRWNNFGTADEAQRWINSGHESARDETWRHFAISGIRRFCAINQRKKPPRKTAVVYALQIRWCEGSVDRAMASIFATSKVSGLDPLERVAKKENQLHRRYKPLMCIAVRIFD